LKINSMKKIFFLLIFPFAIACNSSRKVSSTSANNMFDKEAHRGGRGLMPENTIPAMLHAIDLDVNTLEMDTHISKDGQVVVSHDPYFNENFSTAPEGKVLTKEESRQRVLYTMTYDSIAKYDVGLKPYPAFPHQQKMAVHKPLLSVLIDETESYAKQKGKAIAYNIEIKSKQGEEGKLHPPVEEFVDKVMQVINQKDIASRTIIQSFDLRALQVMHKKYPQVATSLLIEANEKTSLDEQLLQLGFTPSAYSPNFVLVSPSLVQQCHDKKLKIIPWTVNDLAEMKRLQQMGVDGIISDYPNLFKQL
jgi:glycerophosphoryl diester phosphodiesterase